VDTTADPIALTPERSAADDRPTPVAIVGLACRFPDADDPLTLFESALAGRRAFRRMPAARIGPGGPRLPGRAALAGLAGPQPGPLPRAALLDGWEFDRAAFGVSEAAYRAADPAHWLALETAGRALADAGFPGGQGLDRNRAGVIIGNTLTGEIARVATLRSQWPFVAAVLSEALAARDLPAGDAAAVLGHAAAAFAAPLPEASAATLAGSQPGGIADGIGRRFQFRGGGYAVDTAHASSLLAVATGCALLAAGELDFVLAGGVDISLDLFELTGLALGGSLATGAMRIYDASPTGFLPGEGCGMLALMRAQDAVTAGMPRYADIVGWGVSSPGQSGVPAADADSQLLALQRAYQRAQADPAEVGFIEGDGRGTADGDLAELTALTALRAGAPAAALGSVKANIGHTKAAAGAAGLIKAALAVNAGVIPPTTGCSHPHPLLAEEDAVLRVPRSAEPWPAGHRLAAVTATDPAGSTVHVVLRREHNQGSGPGAGFPALPPAAGFPALPPGPAPGPASATGARPLVAWSVPRVTRAEVFAFSGPDRDTVAAELAAVARVAPGLSDSELTDLACQLGRADAAGPVRVAVVAAAQEELTRRATEAAALLPGLEPGRLAARPGLFAADGAAGRVVLLFPGEAAVAAGGPESPALVPAPALAQASLAALRWLDRLGLRAVAGLGVGVGEITALAWSGSLAGPAVATLIAERAAVLAGAAGPPTALVCVSGSEPAVRALPAAAGLAVAGHYGPRCHILGGPADAVTAVARQAAQAGLQARLLGLPYALHTPAMSGYTGPLREAAGRVAFTAPARRVISTVTGAGIGADADLADLLARQLAAPVQLAGALRVAADGADLLLDTGPGQALATLAAGCCPVPAASLGAGPDSLAAPAAAGALFAVGAVATLAPLLAGRPSRPIDLARAPRFLANPVAAAAAPDPPARPAAAVDAWWDGGPAGRDAAAGPAGPGTAAAEPAPDPVPGVAPWARCFAEELRPLPSPPAAVDEEPWRLHATTRQPFGRMAAEVFEDDPSAAGVLAVIGDLADPDGTGTLLAAAREAAGAGSFVLITPAAGLEGFCGVLHAEHPELGLTLIRTTDSMSGLIAAQRFAVTEPGRFRQVVLDGDGEPWEPVMAGAGRPAPGHPAPGGADSSGTGPSGTGDPAGPLEPGPGPADVLLVAGGQSQDLLAAAAALAGSGARLALIGPPGPGEPAATDLALARLRATGAEVSYLQADLTDPDEGDAAVASVEQRIGPVTAVCFLAANGPDGSCATLPAAALRDRMAAQADGLRGVLGSVNAARLRLLLTVGRAAARYGAPGQCGAAVLAGALAEQARRLGPGLPGCRIVHVDWQPVPGAPAEVGQLLLDVMAGPYRPARVAVHGRLHPAAPGGPAGAAAAPGPGGGRFLERIRVHYPAVELVAEATLSAATDPYLADYRVDGLATLPPAIGLEAMAQAASALAGRPLRQVAYATMEVPVLLPPGRADAVLRVCALRSGDTVEAVLRYSGSGFHLDHFRAVFTAGQPGAPAPGPSLASGPGPASGTGLAVAAPGGVVDGTDLYGPVCFQDGPFRRVAFLPEVTARSCRALVRGADDRPWFSGAAAHGGPLILGSPGLNDALMHALQACVPDRRVLPSGFASLSCTGEEVRGAVSLRAARRDGGWDVTALDATGHPVLTITGLRLRDVGPLEHHAPWHPTLLAVALEARGPELGLDPSLRVTLRCGQPGASQPGAGWPPTHPAPPGQPQADSLPWLDQAVGTGVLAGYDLTVRAGAPIACYWEAAGTARPEFRSHPEDLAAQLASRVSGGPAMVRTRARAITACLAAAGWADTAPLQFDDAHDGGWIRVRAGSITVACTAATIDGIPQPVVIALATWPGTQQHPADPGMLAHGAPGR
jgi:enediyne polyketide synthase